MRIIGGQAGGRVIRLPAGLSFRPTTDRIRESLFGILHPQEGRDVVDLFAGCGSVGIESISRGGRQAVFVERERAAAEAIGANLRLLGYEGQAEVWTMDARQGMARLERRGRTFDLVFADPPYDRGYVEALCLWLSDGRLLRKEGVAVIQHSVREPLSRPPRAMLLTDQRRYGDTLLSFLRKEHSINE